MAFLFTVAEHKSFKHIKHTIIIVLAEKIKLIKNGVTFFSKSFAIKQVRSKLLHKKSGFKLWRNNAQTVREKCFDYS